MTDHAEIIACTLAEYTKGVGVAPWDEHWAHARAILDALAAAGVLLTDPEKGDVIVRPAVATADVTIAGEVIAQQHRGFDFSRARVLPCPTCEDGFVPGVDMGNDGYEGDICPDCSDYTLGRTEPCGASACPTNRRLVAPYRLPSPGPKEREA